MNGYKRDRMRDIQFRLGMLALAFAIGGGVWVMGPGLDRVFANALEHKKEAWAPTRMWQVAKVMEWTFREERAQRIYEEFYLLYSGDEERVDFWEVTDDEDQMFYLPWVAHRYDEETRPRPPRVGDLPHALLGKVLIAHGTYWERKRLYGKSRHIFNSVRLTFEPGTEAHTEAVAAFRRDMCRSF